MPKGEPALSEENFEASVLRRCPRVMNLIREANRTETTSSDTPQSVRKAYEALKSANFVAVIAVDMVARQMSRKSALVPIRSNECSLSDPVSNVGLLPDLQEYLSGGFRSDFRQLNLGDIQKHLTTLLPAEDDLSRDLSTLLSGSSAPDFELTQESILPEVKAVLIALQALGGQNTDTFPESIEDVNSELESLEKQWPDEDSSDDEDPQGGSSGCNALTLFTFL